jgi:hypothetical protein
MQMQMQMQAYGGLGCARHDARWRAPGRVLYTKWFTRQRPRARHVQPLPLAVAGGCSLPGAVVDGRPHIGSAGPREKGTAGEGKFAITSPAVLGVDGWMGGRMDGWVGGWCGCVRVWTWPFATAVGYSEAISKLSDWVLVLAGSRWCWLSWLRSWCWCWRGASVVGAVLVLGATCQQHRPLVPSDVA